MYYDSIVFFTVLVFLFKTVFFVKILNYGEVLKKERVFGRFFCKNQTSSIFRHNSCVVDQNCDYEISKMMN